MTNEEFERAIDFLLKSRASFEARLEAEAEQSRERQGRTEAQIAQTNAQLSQLSDRVDALADAQTEFMRVFTKYVEAADQVNKTLAAGQARAEELLARTNDLLRESIGELAAKQLKTEDALARLADAQAQSERRLDALTKIVEEERGGR